MKKPIKMFFVLSLFLLTPQAFAVANGESFLLLPSGAVLCEGLAPKQVTPTNTNKLYLKIENDTAIALYRDAQLTDYIFSIPTKLKSTNKTNSYTVNGAYWLDQDNYLIINGVYKLNKTATTIKSFVIEYIRAGGYDDGSGGPYVGYGPYDDVTCTESGYFFSKANVPPKK